MNKTIKKMAMSSIAFAMVLGGFSTIAMNSIHAEEIYNLTVNGIAKLGNGMATIKIKANAGQTLIGKKFSVYKLFDAENAGSLESIDYTFHDEYKGALQKVVGKRINKDPKQVTEYEVIDYIQTLNCHKVEGANTEQKLEGRYSDFRYFVEELRDTIDSMGLKGTEIAVTDTDKEGNITITGLDYGYYLTDEISLSEGTHSASSLILMNTANPDATVQIKSDYPSIIKKIKEDDNNVGWNDIADYEIGQTVPYKYESSVPNMNGYHTYYFAFHDKMDEALTFHKDSVSIQINMGNKVYTLKNSEFNILENIQDETFKVEIKDLKAIVDREFDQKNSDKENVYGQKITFTYHATLNDKAALDTGRPGFENDVMLEFSNNPDKGHEGETGKTPWDSVVCFTYKLNVTKRNDHNKLLAGAKFRLYSDDKCQNEIFLKQKTTGEYIVMNRDLTGGSDHTGGTTPNEAVGMVTPENGKLTIYGLDQGTFWLKETAAPDGYRPLLDPIELNLTPTFTQERQSYVKGDGAADKTLVNFEATAHIDEFYDGVFSESDNTLAADVDDGSANLTVVNKVGSKLPVTGSNVTILMLGAGAGIMVLGYRKHKKERVINS